MSSNIRQTLVMVRANLLSLPRRLAISLSMLLSVALVVCVLAGFLSMAAGFEKTLRGTGSASVAVILGGGTNQEAGSDISSDVVRSVVAMGDDIGVVRDAEGNPATSREIVVTTEMRGGDSALGKTLALRGMDTSGPALRDGVTLSAGRLFTSGTREIVVGDSFAREIAGFAIGDTVRLGVLDWTVVGHFTSGGSAFESEVWADLDVVRAAFDRLGDIQSLRLRLTDPSAIETVRAALGAATATPLVVLSEAELYASQSSRTSDLIRLFGWPLALLMAVGATAGALNTMMSSVSDRTVEIATVRALGFSRLSAFLATWIEAMLLASAGVFAGLALSWLVFNGWQASSVGANNARMGFQLAVTWDVMLAAGLLGLATGLIGGALPAIAAARLPLTAALRSKG